MTQGGKNARKEKHGGKEETRRGADHGCFIESLRQSGFRGRRHKTGDAIPFMLQQTKGARLAFYPSIYPSSSVDLGWDCNGSTLSRDVFFPSPHCFWKSMTVLHTPTLIAWCSSVSLYLQGSAPGQSPSLPISGEIAHLPLGLSIGIKESVFVWLFSWGQFSLDDPTRNQFSKQHRSQGHGGTQTFQLQ